MSTALSTDLEIAPIAGYLGAEVSGVALAEPIPDPAADRLRAALHEHKVLFFHDQPLDHHAQIRFSSLFGAVTPAHPYEDKAPAGYPEILEVDSRKYATRPGPSATATPTSGTATSLPWSTRRR